MGIPIYVILLVNPSTKLKHIVITAYIYDERGEGGMTSCSSKETSTKASYEGIIGMSMETRGLWNEMVFEWIKYWHMYRELLEVLSTWMLSNLIIRLKQPWSNICFNGELHVTLTWQLPTNKLHDHVCARSHARNRPAPPTPRTPGQACPGGSLGEDSHDGSRVCHLAM